MSHTRFPSIQADAFDHDGQCLASLNASPRDTFSILTGFSHSLQKLEPSHLFYWSLSDLPVLKSGCSRSSHQPASYSLLLVSAVVQGLLKRAPVLRESCTNIPKHLLWTNRKQRGSASNNADSAPTVLNQEYDLSFGVSPLTLCTLEGLTETCICAEIWFDCCCQLSFNNVFHLLVFIIFDLIFWLFRTTCVTKWEDGLFFIKQKFSLLLNFYSFLYTVFPSDCVRFTNFHDKN